MTMCLVWWAKAKFLIIIVRKKSRNFFGPVYSTIKLSAMTINHTSYQQHQKMRPIPKKKTQKPNLLQINPRPMLNVQLLEPQDLVGQLVQRLRQKNKLEQLGLELNRVSPGI